MLKETRTLGCKLVNTPIYPNRKLGQTKLSSSVDKERYQRLVGKLIYTCPNIAFAVSKLGDRISWVNVSNLVFIFFYFQGSDYLHNCII